MIRPTVATVNLDAIQANLREIQGCCRAIKNPRGTARRSPVGGGPRERQAADRASSRCSRRTPTVTARRKWVARSKTAGASMLACADIEEGVSLRESGVGLPILVFGALSVSDLDGIFEHRLTPTVSTPAAARALERAAAARNVRLGCHLKIDTGMNRLGFRHDNLHADDARGARQRPPRVRSGLHALRDRRRAGVAVPRRTARALRSRDGRARRHGTARASRGTPPTRRPSSATRGRGTTPSGPGCCSTASCRPRSRRAICSCDLPCHSRAVSSR